MEEHLTNFLPAKKEDSMQHTGGREREGGKGQREREREGGKGRRERERGREGGAREGGAREGGR